MSKSYETQQIRFAKKIIGILNSYRADKISTCRYLRSKALVVNTCREVDLQSVPSVFLRATQV